MNIKNIKSAIKNRDKSDTEGIGSPLDSYEIPKYHIKNTTLRRHKGIIKKEEMEEVSSIKYLSRLTTESDNEKDKFYEKDFTIISEKHSEEFNFESDEEFKDQTSGK